MSTFFECVMKDNKDVTNKVMEKSCLMTKKSTETEMYVFQVKMDRTKLQDTMDKW